MQFAKFLITLGFVASAPVFAAVPSDASLKNLLDITETRQTVEAMSTHIDKAMRSGMEQALQNTQLTPQQQQIVDKTRDKLAQVMKEEISWEKVEALYMKVYRDSFTQEEVNAMITLYKTPTGQLIVKKMPTVMQASLTEVQARMGSMVDKLQVIQAEMVSELQKTQAAQ